jgi:hypothetical protein
MIVCPVLAAPRELENVLPSRETTCVDACCGTLFIGLPGPCTPIPPVPARLDPDTGLCPAPRLMALPRLPPADPAAPIMFPAELVILGPALLVRGDTPDPPRFVIPVWPCNPPCDNWESATGRLFDAKRPVERLPEG